MRRAVIHPLFWLTVQIVLTVVGVGLAGDLEPRRVPDTRSYEIAAGLDSFDAKLGYYRSLGYPIFLDLVEGLGLDQGAVPTLQLSIYLLSIYLFWWGLYRFSGSKWLAFAGAMSLPWAAVMELVDRIQPDFLSAAATVSAMGLLMWLVTKPRSPGLWAGLIACVVAAYQLRPAAVFLVGFVPVIGGVMFWFYNRRSLRASASFLLVLAIATTGPYWSFCGLRLVRVGHFGLVSFGGTNLAGLAANFISGSLLPELPQEHRRLAKRMLQLRRRLGWSPMRLDDPPAVFFAQYSDNIWKVANPAGKFELNRRRWEYERKRSRGELETDRVEKWQKQPPMVARNTIVGAMSKSVIRSRFDLYLRWVRGAQLYGVRQLDDYLGIVAPFVLLVVSIPIWLLRTRGTSDTTKTRAEPEKTRLSIQDSLLSTFLLGIGFFSGYLLLVSLVSFPFTRYFQSMILFVPMVLYLQLYALWAQIAAPGSR